MSGGDRRNLRNAFGIETDCRLTGQILGCVGGDDDLADGIVVDDQLQQASQILERSGMDGIDGRHFNGGIGEGPILLGGNGHFQF